MTRIGPTTIAALWLAFSSTALQAQSNQVPPVAAEPLLKWLQAGSYKQWARESAPHRSLGPHPTLVVAYLNAALDNSLAAGSETHPKGSAAVKELLDASGKLSGWAVSVKTSTDSDGGRGWYWYEIFGTTSAGRVVAQANDTPLCFGCHTTGKDFVLIAHPLK